VANLVIGLFGDEQVIGRLSRASDRVVNASAWYRMMSNWLEGVVEKQFSTQGGASGGWKALSPGYAAQKAAAGYGGQPILVRDGDLRSSLTSGGGHAIRHIAPHQLVFGSTVKYGPVHQHGGGNGIPARPMLDIARKQKKQIARSFGLFIARDRVQSPSGMFGGVGGGGR